MREKQRMFRLIISLFIVFLSLIADSNSGLYPIKTDHPRDTMKTFIEAMNAYREGVEKGHRNAKLRINDAIRTFAEAPQPISLKEKKKAAIFLKEVIDRIIVIDYEKIPDTPHLHRWRLKDTEITLRPVPDGERKDEWLITYSSWSHAKMFYERVKELPYLNGSGQGAKYTGSLVNRIFPQWIEGETLHLQNWQWLGIFLSLLLGFLIKKISEFLFIRIKHFWSKKDNHWIHEFIKSLEGPFGLLIASSFWALSIIFLNLDGITGQLLNGVVQILFGISAIWALYSASGVLGDFLKGQAEKTKTTLDDQLIPLAIRTLKLAIIIIGALMVLQNMGVNVVSLMAGLGLGGLALALAAKDTAANFFGSLMILLDRPFQIGDWVIIDSVEGTVEDIGFRSTRVRTFYNSLVSVPNAHMVNANVDNMGKRAFRRVRMTLGLTYDTPPEKIESFLGGVKNIILNNKFSHKEGFHVSFTDYGDSSLNILVYYFLKVPDWTEELIQKKNINIEILKLAENLGVSFAFPSRSIYLEKQQINPTSLQE